MFSKDNTKIFKLLNIGSLAIALTIPVAFFVLAFFSFDVSDLFISSLRLCLIPAAISFIYYFFFNKLLENNPANAVSALAFINFTYLLVIINATGGVGSPLFFIFYLVIIFSFFVSVGAGIFVTAFSTLFLLFYIFINKGTISVSEYLLFWPQIFSFIFISIPSLFLGIRFRKTQEEKINMTSITEKLSTGKSQEKAILSSITDGIYSVDTERNLILFNQAAEELTGWDANSAVGLKCWNVMKLRDEADLSVCEKDCPMLQVWNTNENLVREDLCFVNRKKKNTQISGAYSPILDNNGKITGGVCVFRDVTKKKEVERLRNEFVSTASHELRTPITTLEGYIDLASNEKISKIDEKAKEYLGKAHSTVLNMSKIVKNLLSVTKIDEGKIDIMKEDFDLAEFIESTITELKPLADKRELYLEFDKSTIGEKGKKALARSVNVTADKSMIKEVLTNLIENGVKFTTAGGVKIKTAFDNDFATVSVGDTGMGIPQDGIKHLFEKFYRVDNTATREVGGTGLGLYITRSMVELNGGKIWVESKSGKGATFFFTIPRALI